MSPMHLLADAELPFPSVGLYGTVLFIALKLDGHHFVPPLEHFMSLGVNGTVG